MRSIRNINEKKESRAINEWKGYMSREKEDKYGQKPYSTCSIRRPTHWLARESPPRTWLVSPAAGHFIGALSALRVQHSKANSSAWEDNRAIRNHEFAETQINERERGLANCSFKTCMHLRRMLIVLIFGIFGVHRFSSPWRNNFCRTIFGLLLVSSLVKYDCESFCRGRVAYIPLTKLGQWPTLLKEKNHHF